MTSKQKRIRNIRRNARRKLELLVFEQGGFCHYCRKHIVSLAHVQKTYQILKVTHNTVTFIMDGEVVSRLIASVEHITRITEQLTDANRKENIVASCKACNQTQNEIKTWGVRREERQHAMKSMEKYEHLGKNG